MLFLNILYWAAAVPQLSELLFSDLRRSQNNIKLTIQIHPDDKTILVNDARADEVLRCGSQEVPQIKKWLSTSGDNKVLVMDLWSMLFRADFLPFLTSVLDALDGRARAVFLLPKAWTGVYHHHAVFLNMDTKARAFAQNSFQTVRSAFELIWNARSNIHLVTSTPPFPLLEELCGHAGILPQRFLGLQFLPKECKRNGALFATPSQIAKEVLTYLGVIKAAPASKTWALNVQPDVRYLAGTQSRLGLEDAHNVVQNRGVIFSSSWSRYLSKNNSTDSIFLNELARSGAAQEHVLRWYYLQGILAADAAAIRFRCEQHATLLFESRAGQNAAHPL